MASFTAGPDTAVARYRPQIGGQMTPDNTNAVSAGPTDASRAAENGLDDGADAFAVLVRAAALGAVPTIGCQIISNPPLPIFCGGGGPVQMPQRALHRLPSSRILSERSIRHGALSLS